MIEDLSPELDKLLAIERAVPPLPSGFDGRLWTRLVATLGLGATGGGLIGSGTLLLLVLVLGIGAATTVVAMRASPPRASAPKGLTKLPAPARSPEAPRTRATLRSQPEPSRATPSAPSWFGQRGLDPRKVYGRVTSGGRPAAGASITLASFPNAAVLPLVEVVSDDQGDFEFPPQTPWLYVLTASLPGLIFSDHLDLRDPDSVPLQISLRPCHFVRGRVLTDTGEPIAGAMATSLVSLVHFGPANSTDEEGVFELCTSGAHPVRIDASGFGSIVVGPGPDLEAVLSRAAIVSGTVVGPSHQGLPNVQVNLWSRDHGDRAAASLVTVSDNQGRFRFENVGAGRFGLNGWAADFIVEEPVEFAVATGQRADFLVTLRSTASIEGVVIREGRPLVGVGVRALIPKRGLSFGAITQRDGSFTTHGVALGENRLEVDGFEVLSPRLLEVNGPIKGLRVEVR